MYVWNPIFSNNLCLDFCNALGLSPGAFTSTNPMCLPGRNTILSGIPSNPGDTHLGQIPPLALTAFTSLDANENMLNTPDATYDLRKGMAGAMEHSPSDLLTKITTVSPGDKGKDLWEESLQLFFCGNQELIEYVQMTCGLAAIGKVLDIYDGIYDITSVKMTIFQPRRENVSTFTIKKEDLLKWADDFLKPTAELAFNGEGEFKAGDHRTFCKAKATCRKRAEYNLELAKYDFEMPASLSETEIAAILPKIDDLTAWAADIKEYALQQALSGTEYPGFKVVEGRANRKYTDEEAVAFVVKDNGYDPYEKKLLGITAMTSLLGKKKFEELLGALITKPQGKPTLVPASDKRPALNTAKDDFSEEE